MGQTKTPPGPKGRFLLGNSREYLKDPLGFYTQCSHEYGDIVQVRLLPWMKTVVLFHPNYIEEVLRHNHKNFLKDKLTHQLNFVLGDGLLTSEGDFWKRQRRLVQPAFQHSQVMQYASIIVEYTQRMLNQWQVGQQLSIHQTMSQLTLEIVGRALFDLDVREEATNVGQALDTLMNYFENPVNWPKFMRWVPLPSVIRFRRAIRQLSSLMYRIIRERREETQRRSDLLTTLVHMEDVDGTRMSDRDLHDELLTLLLAGHETTALSLAYSFYLLAQHPEVENRLIQELDDKLNGQPPTAEIVRELTWTESILKEAMRLYPPVWLLGREAIQDCEIGGYPISAGTQISMSQWTAHRDPRWHEEPERFDPQRWLDERTVDLPRGAYFPFGDGPRICVGNSFAMMESVLILATVYQKHRLRVVDDKPLNLIPSITLRPRNDITMKLS